MAPIRLPVDLAPRCPACGDIVDFCQGHGPVGDVVGFYILQQHDQGNHSQCHPIGCSDLVYKRERKEISEMPRRIP